MVKNRTHKKYRTLFLYHTWALLVTMVALIIANALDGDPRNIAITFDVLIAIQFIFLVSITILDALLKRTWDKILKLIPLFLLEIVAIILIAMEPMGRLYPAIGHGIFYIIVSITWIMMFYFNGWLFKKYRKK